jgi:hypothetical protein
MIFAKGLRAVVNASHPGIFAILPLSGQKVFAMFPK